MIQYLLTGCGGETVGGDECGHVVVVSGVMLIRFDNVGDAGSTVWY